MAPVLHVKPVIKATKPLPSPLIPIYFIQGYRPLAKPVIRLHEHGTQQSQRELFQSFMSCSLLIFPH